jgi:hypothetical protein
VREKEKKLKKGQNVLKMAIVGLSTLNLNGLNSHIKRHRATEWIKNKIQLPAVDKKL